MTTIASQITSLTVVCSTVYSDADQRKHQSFASVAFVGEFTGPVTRKMFPFDDIIMKMLSYQNRKCHYKDEEPWEHIGVPCSSINRIFIETGHYLLSKVVLYNICTITYNLIHSIEITFNILRPRQNGHHFIDDIYKCIFLIENVWISINMSLSFVLGGTIYTIPALVQIMA